jgi:hypothetical protein
MVFQRSVEGSQNDYRDRVLPREKSNNLRRCPSMTGGEKNSCCQDNSSERGTVFILVNYMKEFQSEMSNGNVLSRGPGIVVLSHSMEVLHMNRQAIKLARLLGSDDMNGQPSSYATGVLPPSLTDLAREILSVLRSRHERSDKGEFEILQSANESGKPVRIRGVGVPNREGIKHVRIVLVLTETSDIHSENQKKNSGSMV